MATPQLEKVITEDGILCKIISTLPISEAVRTCVLSPRWRYIRTHINKLEFDHCMLDAHTRYLVTSLDNPLTNEERDELFKVKTDQFIGSVDSVLQQHQCGRLENFVVHYYLTKLHSHHLDAWVQFAITSKTKRLALHLHKPYSKMWESDPCALEAEPYDFPFQLLGPSSSLEELTLSSCSLRPPCKFDGLRQLRKLNLFYIYTTEEDINRLLCNCLALERLTIWTAPRLGTLRIPHALGQLRYLLVKHCDQLRKISINAVNVNKLHYWGPPVDFILRHSSQLKDARIIFDTEAKERNMDLYLNELSTSLPPLQSLSVVINGVSQVSNLPKVSSSFTRLTRLEWTWSARVKMGLPCLTTLLDAAPFLQKFKLHLWTNNKEHKWHQKQYWIRVLEQPPQSLRTLSSKLPEHRHSNLKTVEIDNFYWDKWQTEIVLYLLKNAVQLESMTLHKGRNSSCEIYETDINNLSQQVSANVKLAIL